MSPLLHRLWRSNTQRVMSLGALGMALALLADVLIVRRFGFGQTTDALVVALILPRLIGTVGRDATKFSLLTVFIHEQKLGDDAFLDLGRRVFSLFLVIGLGLTGLAIGLAKPVTALIGLGLKPDGRALAATLFQLASPIALFALSSAVLEVMLNSKKHFTVTAFRNAVAPSIVITTTLLTWRHDHAVYFIAAAFTTGFALYCLMLGFNAVTRLGLAPIPNHLPNRQTFRKLRGTIGFPLTGFTVRQLARVAERTIASMGPSGSLAAYYYAYRLLAALQNIVGVSVALTGQPKLTEHDLAGDRTRFRKTLRKRVALTLLFSVPAGALLMALHQPIIHLLYSRKGVDPAGLDAAASVLFVLGPAVVFYCLTPVLNAALYAQKRYAAVLYNMCLAAAANVLLAYLLFKRLGLIGVAWAATLAALISVLNLVMLNSRPVKPKPNTNGS